MTYDRSKVHWQRLPDKGGLWVQGMFKRNPPYNTVTAMAPPYKPAGSEQLEEIAAWCRDNECGKRMSFNQFKFRTEEELTMFLLRWS
jgi:hypothetical protein